MSIDYLLSLHSHLHYKRSPSEERTFNKKDLLSIPHHFYCHSLRAHLLAWLLDPGGRGGGGRAGGGQKELEMETVKVLRAVL